eukprot:m.257173 g.257173  ORF g.257173 m.257173 type:complete len:53 (+) comp15525_c6_seq1:707-865(+)
MLRSWQKQGTVRNTSATDKAPRGWCHQPVTTQLAQITKTLSSKANASGKCTV